MLRDVIASSGLAIFAEVGLILFFVTFVFVAVRVLSRRKGYYDAVARQPLDDDDELTGSGGTVAGESSATNPREI